MIFQDYTYYNKFLKIENSTTTKLDDYEGRRDGYFQDHEVGTILFGSGFKSILKIEDEEYDIRTIDEVIYLENGNTRTVRFINTEGDIIGEFNYDVFWIDETDFIELAFELPTDEEGDLLKYIANQINRQQ